MGNLTIIIFLLLIIVCLLFGFYLLKSSSARTSDNDEGIRIKASSHSIVSVRKISDSSSYEVTVEDMPIADMYEEGEFLMYEESPLERWLRTDISDEERRLLSEELKVRYGIDMGWNGVVATVDNEDKDDTSDITDSYLSEFEETDIVAEEEVNPETLMPKPFYPSVNRFDSYDPFAEDEPKDDVRGAVEILMRYIIDNYRKGLLKPELVVHASERYEEVMEDVAEDMSIDIERLRREQNLSGIRVDRSIMDMPFEDFDMYIHDEVASAAVSEVIPEDVEEKDTEGGKAEQFDTEIDNTENIEQEEMDDEIQPFSPKKYDWGDFGEN